MNNVTRNNKDNYKICIIMVWLDGTNDNEIVVFLLWFIDSRVNYIELKIEYGLQWFCICIFHLVCFINYYLILIIVLVLVFAIQQNDKYIIEIQWILEYNYYGCSFLLFATNKHN